MASAFMRRVFRAQWGLPVASQSAFGITEPGIVRDQKLPHDSVAVEERILFERDLSHFGTLEVKAVTGTASSSIGFVPAATGSC